MRDDTQIHGSGASGQGINRAMRSLVGTNCNTCTKSEILVRQGFIFITYLTVRDGRTMATQQCRKM